MCVCMLSQFKYNHEIWFKYSCFSFGFDIYQAKFESAIPGKPIYLQFGKWYIDVRLLKWQILVNKMTRMQRDGFLLAGKVTACTDQAIFNNPTFGF